MRMIGVVGGIAPGSTIDGLIRGGTELPLILSDGAGCRVPMLDTTSIHVDRAVAAMLVE